MPLNIAETTFYEKINLTKLNHILNNYSKYEKTITEHEKLMRRHDNHYNAFNVFEKMRANAIVPEEFEDTEFGYLKITYKKGASSNNIGRWYCNGGIGLQPLCAPVRHTICDDIWIDIDQVNSHPSLLSQLLDKHNLSSYLLNKCITDRENFLKKVMSEAKCSRDEAKTKVIAIINGGYDLCPILVALYDELKPLTTEICNLPEYIDIHNYCKKTYPKNVIGKTIARILQIIENNLLETYVEYFVNEGLIDRYEDGYCVSLIFDGFQILKTANITETILNDCRMYALEKTGYDVELKIKPFELKLPLPDDYAMSGSDNVKCIMDYHSSKVSSYITMFGNEIYEAIGDKGSHASLSNICHKILKGRLVYDDETKLWFHCNMNNVWVKRKSDAFIKSFIKQVLYAIFVQYENCIINPKLAEAEVNDKDKVEYLERHKKVCGEIALKLKMAGIGRCIVEMAMIDFSDNKFYEKKLDSRGDLFAFSNKVLDCKLFEVRPIRPSDYIMNNTGYVFPETSDPYIEKEIISYYNTIYPEQEICEYMWNADSLLLNGERPFQTFEIHTGSGCNSKSTKMASMKQALGDYFYEVNAETFTKSAKSANSTSELAHAKGRRMIFFNEPENDGENKLQVGLLKKIADGHKGVLKARGLYQEAVEFPIFFRVIGCCNNKPILSSADGGIGRRVRPIDYPVKFVENPDPNLKFQAKLDTDMVNKLTSPMYRNTHIRMLIQHFINVSSKLTYENVPARIMNDAKDYIADSNPVLGFIMESYTITNNVKDKVKSSDLFTHYKYNTGNKIHVSAFKDYMLNIGGITFDRGRAGNCFCGLVKRIDEEEEE